jgi:hypothetical protein
MVAPTTENGGTRRQEGGRPYSRTGMLLSSGDRNVILAFQALVEGLRSGRHIDTLHDHCEILSASIDRAFESQEGIRYLESRPISAPQSEFHPERSSP